MKKRNQYSTTLDDELATEFERCIRITGMDSSLLLREFIKAFVAAVRESGGIWFPFTIAPKATKSSLPHDARGAAGSRSTHYCMEAGAGDPRLNEAPPKYGAKKTKQQANK